VNLLFLHGWGFDASIWDGVRGALGGIDSVAWDLGYFGHPLRAAIVPPFLAVGHSAGSLFLAADPPPGCRGLIAINGFDRFAGDGLVAPRALDRMRNRFAVAPGSVLDDFRLRAGGAAHEGALDPVPLARDLGRLASDDARGRTLPMLVLHGDEDPILPPAMRDIVFAGAPRVIVKGGGHLLPLTDPGLCADHIRAVIG